jgi:hypothetical protein
VAPLAGASRLTVLESGSVGIGTNNPARRLHVLGDRIRLENAGKLLDLRADGGAVDLHSETTNLYLRSSGGIGNNRIIMNPFGTDGNVGIGTEFPNVKLHVVGDLTVEGTARSTTSSLWTFISDLRLKKNIEPLTQVLERLLRLRGVRFEWNAPEGMGGRTGPQMGLIADEVEPVFPEWVGTGPSGYKELTLQGFEALIIEVLRELHAEIAGLKARLDTVEKRPRRTAP